MQCGNVGVYCVRLYVLEFSFVCVTVSSVVFMEGRERESAVWHGKCCIV